MRTSGIYGVTPPRRKSDPARQKGAILAKVLNFWRSATTVAGFVGLAIRAAHSDRAAIDVVTADFRRADAYRGWVRGTLNSVQAGRGGCDVTAVTRNDEEDAHPPEMTVDDSRTGFVEDTRPTPSRRRICSADYDYGTTCR
ncbi:hypothetical protein V9T40_014941 [Parthenolecanium corni]|uniref:Uncharacterized protein n=1 Tax=Parthenolecanium corni TaxID=536013 RepID=A0AAN9TJN7_9HEMI